MTRTSFVIGVLAAFGLASLVQAQAPTELRTASTAERFADQALAIRQEMEPGGRYEFVTTDEKQRVGHLLEYIAQTMAKHRSANGMTDRELADVLTAQEEANAVLTRRDGDRLICEASLRTGTHLATVNCRRYAEREQARRYTEDYSRHSIMMATQCGGGEMCPDRTGHVHLPNAATR